MERPFEVEGLDLDEGTVVIEIKGGVARLVGNCLRDYEGQGLSVVRAIGAACHKASLVLRQGTLKRREQAATAEGFIILDARGDSVEDELVSVSK